MMTEEDIHNEALERVKEKKKFKGHLNSFLSTMVFFFLINLFSSPGRWWFYWPMLGWGIGLFAHYQKVYGPNSKRQNLEWERKQYQKEIDKLKGKKDIPVLKSKKDPTLDLNQDNLELKKLKELRREYDDTDLV